MAFEYDGKIYRNLEEQVDYNKDCINDLDLRVDTLEKQPAYKPTDLDLNTGIVAVTYDTTDGISLTTQGTIKSNTGTDQVVVDYEIPIVAGNSISIDKKANEDKIEVKVDSSKVITATGFHAKDGITETYLYSDNLQYWDYEGNQYMLTFPSKSGTLTTENSFKTINGNSIVGSGDIIISGGSVDVDTIANIVKGGTGIVAAKNTSAQTLTIRTDPSSAGWLCTALEQKVGVAQSGDTAHLAFYLNPSPTIEYKSNSVTRWFQMPAKAAGTYTLTTTSDFKTLFGNKSIVGTGNIDLYLHKIFFRGQPSSGAPILCAFNLISSNNLQVDSLTDLKTLLGNSFLIAAPTYQMTSGNDFAVIGSNISETGIYAPRQIIENDLSAPMMTWPSGEWTDTVTTV